MQSKDCESVISDSLSNTEKPKTKAALVIFSLLVILCTAETLPFLKSSAIPSYARDNGFLLVALGAIVVVIAEKEKIKPNKAITAFLPFAFIGSISTVVMAIFLNGQTGELFGVTPVEAVGEGLLWLWFDVIIIIFVTYAYAHCSLKLLNRIFDALLIFALFFGTIQAGVWLGIPWFSAAFDVTNIGGWFSIFEKVAPNRISVICSEPSSVGKTFGLLLLPYCYCRAANGNGKKYSAAFVALLILAYMTKSTTVYVTVAFVVIAILLLRIRGKKSKLFYAVTSILLAIMLVCSVFLVTSGDNAGTADISETVQTVLGKITDTTNQSTAYRNSTIINDLEIFKSYPILGVGDGNQGFFYAQNLPSWVLATGSGEAARALSGGVGVLNGGAFIPSLFSGYGFVGCVLFAVWLVSCIQMAFANKEGMGHFYEMFFISLFACAPICWMAIGFQGAPVVVFLILCMPTLGTAIGSNQGIDSTAVHMEKKKKVNRC